MEEIKQQTPGYLFFAGVLCGIILDSTNILPILSGFIGGVYVAQNYNAPNLVGITKTVLSQIQNKF